MKKFLIALLFAPALAVVALASPYQGKLDLGVTNPEAIALRELHDGMWLVGAQTQIWHLQNDATQNEVFHVSGFWATRLEGQDTAYGPSVGVNIGEAAAAFIDKLEIIAPSLETIGLSLPPWALKLSDWTSVELYGGYRPTISADDHHWIYGVGGKVTIPLSQIYAWAAGTQAQGTGVKGL